VWWLCVSITTPGDPIYKRDALGIRYVSGYEEQAEEWTPLASWIIRHRPLTLSDEKIIAPMTLEDALLAEGWTPPDESKSSE
jgi:hypothetical protein